jgi:hypothetical protein
MSKLLVEDGFNSPQRTADPLKAEPQIPLCRLFKNNHSQCGLTQRVGRPQEPPALAEGRARTLIRPGTVRPLNVS